MILTYISTQTSSFSSHTGGLSSATSAAHGGGGEAVELEDGGEELSTPVVKRKCVVDEHGMSLASGFEGESVHSESVTFPRHVHYQHHQYQHCSSQPLSYIPPFQPPYYPHQVGDRPPAFHLPPGQPSYELIQPFVYQSHIWSPTYQSPHNPVLSPLRYNTLLDAYADFLRSCYEKHENVTKWPHLDARKYIHLAVISNKYADRKDLVKFRQQTIHGSIDDILEWKAPIEMKDILKPNRLKENGLKGKEEIKEYPVIQLLIEGQHPNVVVLFTN